MHLLLMLVPITILILDWTHVKAIVEVHPSLSLEYDERTTRRRVANALCRRGIELEEKDKDKNAK